MDWSININTTFVTISSVIISYLLYKLFTINFNHWKDRNVPYIQPYPIFGNFWKVFTFRAQIGQYIAELYNQFETPYFGMFIFNRPLLVIRSPDLMKLILVRDFHNFNDRTVLSDGRCDSMGSKFLFLVKNPEWKFIRTKIAPVFSTGKLKNMVGLMNKVAEDMKTYIRNYPNMESLEAKEIFAKYATDVIGSCAFGVNANSFKYEDAEFRKHGRLIFDTRLRTSMAQTFSFVAPTLAKVFKLPFFDPRFTSFVRKVFWEIYHDRKNNNITRNDLIDTIMQIEDMCKSGECNLEFEGDRVPAQAAHFFAAGFETVSSTASFALYEVCLQPKVQNRVREEIKSTLAKHGRFSFEALKSMPYLDMVLLETLRKYPALPFLDRTCLEDYKVPDTDLVIEKGTPVYIPVFGLHYDSRYFPDPEKFDPERFSEENKNRFPEFAFIPFGKGPRSCIGERFGYVSTKLSLAQVLSEFEVGRNSETPVPLEYVTKGFLLASNVGLPIRFKKIDS